MVESKKDDKGKCLGGERGASFLDLLPSPPWVSSKLNQLLWLFPLSGGRCSDCVLYLTMANSEAFKILVATDIHVGYLEKDKVRGKCHVPAVYPPVIHAISSPGR